MSKVQNITGKYPYDFTTGTVVLILKRDKFAREDILKIINDDKLDDIKRKEKSVEEFAFFLTIPVTVQTLMISSKLYQK